MKKIILSAVSALLLVASVLQLTACNKKIQIDTSLCTYEITDQAEGSFYTTFVYSFADGDGDGIGDLKGLTQKLDYLNDGKGGGLGVTGLWLLPIFQAYTFHKYDIEDYYAIDKQYGTMEDFNLLISECHKRGIKVILDLVLNCTSNKNEWFLSALNDKNSPYRKYYWFYDDLENIEEYDLTDVWNGYKAWSKYDKEGNPYDITYEGDEYGELETCVSLYAGYMPDLNYNNPETVEEMYNFADFWLDKGIDGFRLDSAPHIYSDAETTDEEDFDALNYTFWTNFREHCEKKNANCYLVGEVLTSNTDYRAEYMRSIGSDFDWKLIYDMRDELKKPTETNALGRKIAKQYETYRKVTDNNYTNAPFLTDADVNRVAGIQGVENDPAKIKLVNIVAQTVEGLPFMYYGDEIGMLGNKSSGEIFKLSFPWGDDDPLATTKLKYSNIYNKKADGSDAMQPFTEQLTDPNSIYSAISGIVRLRAKTEALAKGKIEEYTVSAKATSYKMVSESQEAVIIHNFNAESISIAFAADDYKMIYLTDATELIISDGAFTLLPYQSVVFLKNK